MVKTVCWSSCKVPLFFLRCGIPVVLGQQYKVVVCIYLYIYTVMKHNNYIQLVAIYNMQLHVSALYVGHHQVV